MDRGRDQPDRRGYLIRRMACYIAGDS